MALERAYLAGMDMDMGDYDDRWRMMMMKLMMMLMVWMIRTALHLACSENHPACVKYLIETCKVNILQTRLAGLCTAAGQANNGDGGDEDDEDVEDVVSRLTWIWWIGGVTLLSRMP